MWFCGVIVIITPCAASVEMNHKTERDPTWVGSDVESRDDVYGSHPDPRHFEQSLNDQILPVPPHTSQSSYDPLHVVQLTMMHVVARPSQVLQRLGILRWLTLMGDIWLAC